MIGVTGASGGVGSRVVRLLARGTGSAVVALARRPDAVPAAARVEPRWADYDDRFSLRAALAGVRTLVFVSSDGEPDAMRRHHEHVIAAAVAAGVERVVYTSILDVAPESAFCYAAVHRETEAMLDASGLARCLARTSIFADYFLPTRGSGPPSRRGCWRSLRAPAACRSSAATTRLRPSPPPRPAVARASFGSRVQQRSTGGRRRRPSRR
jgi:uncharacterized protein YbjT (DUF2867 family)